MSNPKGGGLVDALVGIVTGLGLLVFLAYEVTITVVGVWEWDAMGCPSALIDAVQFGRPGDRESCP